MVDAYHELANVALVDSPGALTIGRARALLDAVERQRDYSLVQLFRHPVDGDAKMECLVVEVECDGVPPNNSAGIRYRERLALCVPSDPKSLVEVLALRRDFPVLMHQNQGGLGIPASLCLYFEPPAVVNRTWTPAAFLRRIQWWLEMSARGALHPADQPVEHLFFASKYELVLPWNIDELRKNPEHHFQVAIRHERPDKGFTAFLEPLAQAGPEPKTATHIELALPPIPHGVVEHDPVTLGELADLLSRRNVDLNAPLRSALQAKVGASGATAPAGDKATVILLHIPIQRSADLPPDVVTHRAFVVPVGALDLGVATGALMRHENRYFKDALNPQPATVWRDQPVMPMAVLVQNDGAAARRQSGVAEEGPAAVLIGAGSLGSALLNLWGRGGWGRWTVVDKDHIKPHNVSRHTAYAMHVGETKVTAVAGLHRAAMAGATEVVPLVADATDLTQDSLSKALQAAELVVDASTTLEYPRAASMSDALPRHCSVFVTPDGNAAVLLAEDARRAQRLRTLEAQYYRALVQTDVGKIHLQGRASTFWSGASCRDISAVMPYSRILGHASTLAEQVQSIAARQDALIRIWQRDPVRGSVEVHDVPVQPEQHIPFGALSLFFDDGVEQQLRSLRQRGFPNETGGVLLGYYDFNVNAAFIVAGLPAPPDSRASQDSFERGVAGLADAVKEAGARTGGVVGYIGEWHSHPPGHSASPSTHDIAQLVYLALGMAEDGLPAVQLIVGEHDLQLLRAEVK